MISDSRPVIFISHQLSSQLPLHQSKDNSNILNPEVEKKTDDVHKIPETRNEFTQAKDEQFQDLVNSDNKEVEDEVFVETDKMMVQRLRVRNRKYFNDDYVTFTTQEMLTNPMTVDEALLSVEATEWQHALKE